MRIPVKFRGVVVAGVDFVIGFFCFFGGGNIRVHPGGSEGLDAYQIIGVLSMFLGLALFLSAFLIVGGHKPRFRPFVYLLLAAVSTGVLLYPGNPVSRQDVLAWALVMTVLVVCILLQRALDSRRVPPQV